MALVDKHLKNDSSFTVVFWDLSLAQVLITSVCAMLILFLNQHVMCYQMKCLIEDYVCSISFITFVNKTGLQHHLFHYSAWDHYQADKSTIILFSCLHWNRIGSPIYIWDYQNALSVEISRWKSSLTVQGYHQTALLKALDEDCLDLLIWNVWFY